MDAAEAAFARIEALDAALSDWRTDSELAGLCARAGAGPVVVSTDLFAVLARAQEIAEASDGAFDVTIGPLVRLWRRARTSRELPRPEELEAARALTGWRRVRLDSVRGTVDLDRAGMDLDLGAIGKGFTCDRVIDVLRANGIERALVEIGGDIAVSAPPPSRSGWAIVVDDQQRLMLRDAAIASSGDREQFVEIAGTRYSHVVDQRTGLGLTSRVQATVVAPDGATADALATAVSILGQKRGLALVALFPRSAIVRMAGTEPSSIREACSRSVPGLIAGPRADPRPPGQ